MLENDNVSDRDNMNDQYNEDRERMTKKKKLKICKEEKKIYYNNY